MMDRAPATQLHEGLRSLLEHMGKIKASDLYLIAGHPPVFRVDDVSYPARVPLEAEDVSRMADSFLSAKQRERLRTSFEASAIFALRTDERFRASVFAQRGTIGAVLRRLVPLRTLTELGHDPELQQLALSARGLVLVVGDKRSGRSTTLAALVDHRNTSKPGHILTIEDPIEIEHAHKQCVVTQREIGTDAVSFAAALASAPLQAPDLIFASEIRDAETMEALIQLAEAGYACFSTLHASSASHALERVVSFFPEPRHGEMRARLARTLRAVIAQRLVRALPEGRVAALELLVSSPSIEAMIRRGELDAIGNALRADEAEGSRSFDTSLFALCSTGRVSSAEAASRADEPDALLARLQRLHESGRAEAPLRLAAEPFDGTAPLVTPAADRRSKVGPAR
jgi:twitching motility protein PilU